MDLTNFWYSSGSTGGGGGGDFDIGESLRFRGANTLNDGTPNLSNLNITCNTVFTYSAWVKNATINERLILFSQNRNAGSNPPAGEGPVFQINNGAPSYYANSQSLTTFNGDPRLRDPSGWYHIVLTEDNSTQTLYINGVQYNRVSNIGLVNGQSTAPFQIGCAWRESGYAMGDMYLADVYFIDGQVLEPTAFGRENDEGVWVPREVDFTPATMRFSDFLTATTWDGSFPPENAFDGNIATRAQTASGDMPMTFAPDPAIDYTRLRVFSEKPNKTASLNGAAAVNLVENDWTELDNTAGTLTTLVIDATAGTPTLNAIEITDADGTRILTNPLLYSADTRCEPGGTDPALPLTQCFDGLLSTKGAPLQSDGVIIFEPNPALPFTNGVWANVNHQVSSPGEFRITIDGVASAWTTFPNPDNSQTQLTNQLATGAGSLEKLEIRRTDANRPALIAVGLNGNNISNILIDGVNNSYGANGFHLDFSDPDDLGADSSGNGNDFTASGFNTDPVGIFSAQQAGSPAGSYQADPANRTTSLLSPGNAFNGDLSNQVQVATPGGWYYWTPTLTGVNSLRFGYNSSAVPTEVRINGTSVAFTTGNSGPATAVGTDFWCDITVPADGIVNEVAFVNGSAATNNQMFGFLLNGNTTDNIVVDNTGEDYDLMADSPTQNFATLNPLQTYRETQTGDPLYTNANLQVSQQVSTTSTIGMPVDSGIYYWEGTWNSTNNSTDYMGIVLQPMGPNAPPNGFTGWTWVNTNVIRWVDNGTSGATFTVPTLPVTFGWQYDSGAHTLTVFQDGTQVNQFTGVAEETWYAIGMGLGATNGQKTFNFGQQPFLHRPAALTDTTELQTQNLPEATITDGREHFRAVIWNGDDTSPRTLPVGFEPDLVWIKSRPNATSHMWWDRVRGFGASREILSDSTRAEGNATTNTAGAGFVSGTTADGFTVEAGTLNDAYVNDGVRNYVAFCWRADGAAVANTDGSIASQISANTDAGFSIISYTGTGANATVGHGLNETPEFILCKNRDRDINWTGYHVGSNTTNPQNFYLSLNTNEQAQNDSLMWRALPTDAVISLGTYNFNNANGEDLIMYAWHSVPGYSAFGSYRGNAPSGSDGVFVYTGFRPAFVMCKRTDSAGDWVIMDTTRDVNNPANQWLEANSLNAESAPSTGPMDILSNGFKHRGASGQLNTNGDYVYCAFAENPFGGNNVSPANAR